jgi:hypothetical protein
MRLPSSTSWALVRSLALPDLLEIASDGIAGSRRSARLLLGLFRGVDRAG